MSGGRQMLAVVLAALVLAACGGMSRGEFEDEVHARGGGLGATLALDALAALEDELGDDLALRSLTMTLGQVSAEVLVPGTDDQLDSYRFGTSGLYGGGGLSGPTAVTGVGGPATLRPTLFRPARIAFDRFDELIDTAVADADLNGGFAQSVRVGRDGERTVITVTVQSERENAQVRFRGDGTPLGDGTG